MNALVIVGVAYLLFLGWFVVCVLSAPYGFEDDEGFHFLEETVTKGPRENVHAEVTRSNGSTRA